MRKKKTVLAVLIVFVLALALGGCRNTGQDGGPLKKVTLMLDWTPNTNHTGFYVAQAQGYFEERGLDVNILLPGDASVITAVAAGNVDFGISFQEDFTQALAQDVPAMSVAAIIQHNTAGFVSVPDKGIERPKDFEGKTYGGWGSPVEEAVIEAVMASDDADAGLVEHVNIGNVDFFVALERDVDFVTAYYGWTGIEAELREFPLNIMYLKDLSPQLDYYTPILVAGNKIINEEPELVRDFLAAVSAGYDFAIRQPQEAAEILIAAEPDLDPELVRKSQAWLADKYQSDAPRWGEQKQEIWAGYTEWMLGQELLEKDVDVSKAFTNQFLPED